MRRWVAVGVTVLWAVGYILAIVWKEPALAAAATPVALVAVGYLLGAHAFNGGEKEE